MEIKQLATNSFGIAKKPVQGTGFDAIFNLLISGGHLQNKHILINEAPMISRISFPSDSSNGHSSEEEDHIQLASNIQQMPFWQTFSNHEEFETSSVSLANNIYETSGDEPNFDEKARHTLKIYSGHANRTQVSTKTPGVQSGSDFQDITQMGLNSLSNIAITLDKSRGFNTEKISEELNPSDKTYMLKGGESGQLDRTMIKSIEIAPSPNNSEFPDLSSSIGDFQGKYHENLSNYLSKDFGDILDTSVNKTPKLHISLDASFHVDSSQILDVEPRQDENSPEVIKETAETISLEGAMALAETIPPVHSTQKISLGQQQLDSSQEQLPLKNASPVHNEVSGSIASAPGSNENNPYPDTTDWVNLRASDTALGDLELSQAINGVENPGHKEYVHESGVNTRSNGKEDNSGEGNGTGVIVKFAHDRFTVKSSDPLNSHWEIIESWPGQGSEIKKFNISEGDAQITMTDGSPNPCDDESPDLNSGEATLTGHEQAEAKPSPWRMDTVTEIEGRLFHSLQSDETNNLEISKYLSYSGLHDSQVVPDLEVDGPNEFMWILKDHHNDLFFSQPRQVAIRLDPPELGQVLLRIHQNSDTSFTARITIDNGAPKEQVLQLVQRLQSMVAQAEIVIRFEKGPQSNHRTPRGAGVKSRRIRQTNRTETQ